MAAHTMMLPYHGTAASLAVYFTYACVSKPFLLPISVRLHVQKEILIDHWITPCADMETVPYQVDAIDSILCSDSPIWTICSITRLLVRQTVASAVDEADMKRLHKNMCSHTWSPWKWGGSVAEEMRYCVQRLIRMPLTSQHTMMLPPPCRSSSRAHASIRRSYCPLPSTTCTMPYRGDAIDSILCSWSLLWTICPNTR